MLCPGATSWGELNSGPLTVWQRLVIVDNLPKAWHPDVRPLVYPVPDLGGRVLADQPQSVGRDTEIEMVRSSLNQQIYWS